jgi:Domain of unknown function (DUF4360)
MLFFLQALLYIAQAQRPISPVTDIQIVKIANTGSGCPNAASVNTLLSDSNTKFVVRYTTFEAGVGSVAALGNYTFPPEKNTSFCEITLNMTWPAGYSYSLLSLDFAGSLALPNNVNATVETTFFYPTPVNSSIYTGTNGTSDISSTSCGPISSSNSFTSIPGPQPAQDFLTDSTPVPLSGLGSPICKKRLTFQVVIRTTLNFYGTQSAKMRGSYISLGKTSGSKFQIVRKDVGKCCARPCTI